MTQEIVMGFVGLAATTGGAAWVAVKLSLNGIRAGQVRLESGQLRLEDKVDARFETYDARIVQNREDIIELRAE